MAVNGSLRCLAVLHKTAVTNGRNVGGCALQYRPKMTTETERYRGRRRAPAPPRGRYAAVITSAVAGAGIVAFGASVGVQDAKVDTFNSDASALAEAAALRDQAIDQTSRGDRGLNSSINQAPKDVWLLPMRHYRYTSKYGQRWLNGSQRMHAGIDLGGIRSGTPISAVHDGTVILSRWNGGYGNNVVIDHGNGLTSVYGHGSKLLVKEGQQIKAGEEIMLAGNTGHSFGVHLHLEIRINDRTVEPIKFLKERGVDILLEIDAVSGTGS